MIAEIKKTLALESAQQSIFDVFLKFKNSQQQNESAPRGLVQNTQKVLNNIIVPMLGGSLPVGMSRTDITIYARAFLKEQPAEHIADLPEALEPYLDVLGVPIEKQATIRHYVNRFCRWALETELSPQATQKQKKSVNIAQGRLLRAPTGVRYSPTKQIKLTSKKKKANYALGSCEGDFVNDVLQEQLDALGKYLKNFTPEGRKTVRETVMRVLGCIARSYIVSPFIPKGQNDTHQSQDEVQSKLNPQEVMSILRLEHIIRVSLLQGEIKLEVYLEEYGEKGFINWLIDRYKTKETEKKEAKKSLGVIKSYLDFYSNNASSRCASISHLMALARFLYAAKFSDDDDDDDDTDSVSIAKKLRTLQKKEAGSIDPQSREVPLEAKTLESWGHVLDVLEGLRWEADQLRYYRKERKNSKRLVEGTLKTGEARSKAYKRFLIVSFLTVLPPDRQQMVRFLMEGETLLSGEVTGLFPNEWFTPAAKMSNPQEAQWYIKLEKYKTTGIYGTFHLPVPNTWMGSKWFYAYIDEWLETYRNYFSPKCNYFFVNDSGEQLRSNSVYDCVRSAFNRYTGKQVGPQALRHIYQTEIENDEAAKDVKNIATLAMRQSNRIADSIYRRKDLQKRFKAMNQFNQKHFFEARFGKPPARLRH